MSSRACARSAAVVAERARARTASSGVSPPGAGPAKPRTATSRSSPSRPMACSSRRSTAWATAATPRVAARTAGRVVRERPSRDLVLAGRALPRRPARHPRSGHQPGLRVPAERHDDLAGRRQRRGTGARAGLRPPRDRRARSRSGSGVLGHELPSVRAATLDVRPGDVLVLATDGIQAALRGLARRLRLGAGDHRTDPGRAQKAHGRCAGGGCPLPRAAPMTGAGGMGAASFSGGVCVRPARTTPRIPASGSSGWRTSSGARR